MKLLWRTALPLSALLLVCAGHGRAQSLSSSVQLRDVPFQATQVVTRESPAGTTTTRGRIARDHTGSTYVEMVDTGTGLPTTAFLLDVDGHRGIVLDLVHKLYRIRPAPQLSSRELAANTLPDLLEAAARSKGRSEHDIRNGIPCTLTHLGTRPVAGLLSIGSTETWPNRPGEIVPAHQVERWFSVELGVLVRMTEWDRARQQRTEVSLTEVVRAEPDPALFHIPPDFRAEQDASPAPGLTPPGEAADGD